MKLTGETDLQALLLPAALNPSPNSDLLQKRSTRRPPRRKTRNAVFSGAGVRLKRDGAQLGKQSRPETPLLRWKFQDGEEDVSLKDNKSPPEVGRKCARKVRKAREAAVSSRKLAAGLWRLQLPQVATGGGERHCLLRNDRLGFLLEPSFQFSNIAMEGATKWDPVCLNMSDEIQKIQGHSKLLNQQVGAVSVISALKMEVDQARDRINVLETERRSSKKKLEHFLRKLSEERATWRSKEHEKIRSIIDDIKAELNRERKNRQRMEIVNSKLVNELADAKLAAKRLIQNYEKERKARELIEEVCDDLAKEVGEDKAEVEALKRESMQLHREVEEERKMLQMAEVWREERVQMKLIDAKVMLEEKYSHLNNLIGDLETLMSSRRATPDMEEMRKAKIIRQAAASVNIQDIEEFTYDPPNPDDIFSGFEYINFNDSNEREIEPRVSYSTASHSSKIHTVSPEGNVFNQECNQKHSNAYLGQNGDIEEDRSGWETVSHPEDQGSSYSPGENEPSVKKFHRTSNLSGNGMGWEVNASKETPITEISEVFPVPKMQMKEVPSMSGIWRSCPSENKIITAEGMNGRLSNVRHFDGENISPEWDSAKGSRLGPPDLVEHWSSLESQNPHITRGMKGCIEWPLSIQKNSLKSKLLEARMECQKIQLHHVLQQKI